MTPESRPADEPRVLSSDRQTYLEVEDPTPQPEVIELAVPPEISRDEPTPPQNLTSIELPKRFYNDERTKQKILKKEATRKMIAGALFTSLAAFAVVEGIQAYVYAVGLSILFGAVSPLAVGVALGLGALAVGVGISLTVTGFLERRKATKKLKTLQK